MNNIDILYTITLVLTGTILGAVSTTFIPRLQQASPALTIPQLLHALSTPSVCPHCNTRIPFWRSLPIINRIFHQTHTHCCHTPMDNNDTYIEISGILWAIALGGIHHPIGNMIPIITHIILGWIILNLFATSPSPWRDRLIIPLAASIILCSNPNMLGVLIFFLTYYTIKHNIILAMAMIMVPIDYTSAIFLTILSPFYVEDLSLNTNIPNINHHRSITDEQTYAQ